RAAVAAGVRAVMTAHLLVPAWDSAPATLSRPILTGRLREELGFGGLVITDGLEMAAIRATVGLAAGAVAALAAGADALCVGGGPGHPRPRCRAARGGAGRRGAAPRARPGGGVRAVGPRRRPDRAGPGRDRAPAGGRGGRRPAGGGGRRPPAGAGRPRPAPAS